ncbi:MAG: hypothetical protein DWP92_01425 [Armatimonadetes bacterium]|nr:MAG: hypothetical protein DWP92_01425 [Armatimonadota bacterium]
MLCLACSAPGSPLCFACEQSLQRAPGRIVGTRDLRVGVSPVFVHREAAARLVHNLKYRRSIKAGELLAAHMADLVPLDADALVPIPRVLARRVSYGIDQTTVLARLISDLTGIPVRRLLRIGVWHRRSAGLDRQHRPVPVFEIRGPISRQPVLVDDVCTTGSTVVGAALALGFSRIQAVVASSATGIPGRQS